MLYLSIPISNLKEDPLEIWKDLKTTLTSLCNISKRHRQTPETSVTVKR